MKDSVRFFLDIFNNPSKFNIIEKDRGRYQQLLNNTTTPSLREPISSSAYQNKMTSFSLLWNKRGRTFSPHEKNSPFHASCVTDLQQRCVHVGHNVWQPPPLADGQAGGHFHQPLDKVELLLFRVADGQVASVHVHLPCHLLRTAQLHLGIKKQSSTPNWITYYLFGNKKHFAEIFFLSKNECICSRKLLIYLRGHSMIILQLEHSKFIIRKPFSSLKFLIIIIVVNFIVNYCYWFAFFSNIESNHFGTICL